jgi:hypothetical protein
MAQLEKDLENISSLPCLVPRSGLALAGVKRFKVICALGGRKLPK